MLCTSWCFKMDYNLLVPSKIVRSKRHSISLIINNNNELIVRAPLKCAEKAIYDFIYQKSEWIVKKRAELKSHSYAPLKAISGEKIPILDNIYEIMLYDKSRVKLVNNIIYLPKVNSSKNLLSYIKKFTKNYITKRVEVIAKTFNFKYKDIKISSARTRWGSCNYLNSLSFTYKLILCPKTVVDYIIIHELSHTIEKNHSKKFWNIVKTCCPNYKESEHWLKENRQIINLI